MSAVPSPTALPSLLSQQQAALVEALTGSLDGAGLWWLSGYAAGLARSHASPRAAAFVVADTQAAAKLTIVYGTQTANARRVAETLAA